RLRRFDLDGTNATEIELPELGSLVGFDADSSQPRAFISFTSFTRPSGLWRWTPDRGLEPWSDFAVPFQPDDYRRERVPYTSPDGTSIPMFLVRAATTTPNRATPTVLTGYGGFAIAMSPAFSPAVVEWCNGGGLYAIACLRGGIEYGEDWHRAGMRQHKQQVFDDFSAAADWLVAQGLTGRDSLGISGRS